MWYAKHMLSQSLLGLLGMCAVHEIACAATIVNNSDLNVAIYLEAKNGGSQSDIILHRGASYTLNCDQICSIAIGPISDQSILAANNIPCRNNYELVNAQFVSATRQRGDTIVVKGMERNLSCELLDTADNKIAAIPLIPGAWY